MAYIGHIAGYKVGGVQYLLYIADGGIGTGKAAALGAVYFYEQDGFICCGKEAHAYAGEEHERADKGKDRDTDNDPGPFETKVEQWAVETGDDCFHPAGKSAGFGFDLFLFEEAPRKYGGECEGKNQRKEEHEHDGDGQGLEKFARSALHERQREEGEHGGGGRGDDGKAYLCSAFGSGFSEGIAQLAEAHDVFYHHDAVVYQQTKGNHQCSNADLLQGKAKVVEGGNGNEDGNGDDGHDDEGGSPAKEDEDDQSYEQDALHEVDEEVRNAGTYRRGLLKACLQGDALGELAVKAGDDTVDGLVELQDVFSPLLVDIDEEGTATLVAGEPALVFIVHAYFCDVSELHDAALAGRDDRSADLFQTAVGTAGLDVEGLAACVDVTTGDIEVVPLQDGSHLPQTDVLLGHAGKVESDANLFFGIGIDLDFLEAFNLFQLKLQVFCDAVQLVKGSIWGNQGQLPDRGALRRVYFVDVKAVEAVGQLVANDV